MQTVQQQVFSLLLTIGIGFSVGLVYEVYRINKDFWGFKKLGTFLGDFLLWIFITVFVFTLLLLGNAGEVRVYVFLGLGLGFFTYIKFCSHWGRRILSKILFLFYRFGKIIALIMSFLVSVFYKKER